jgi:hypothetical protein
VIVRGTECVRARERVLRECVRESVFKRECVREGVCDTVSVCERERV